jgi:uncharacterized membrane protein YbaN (DUF454 family)
MPLDSRFEGTSLEMAGSRGMTNEVLIETGFEPASGPRTCGEIESGSQMAGRVDYGPGVWIECHECSGEVTIRDPRLFCSGREAFCRAVAVAAVERFQARRVVIDLTSSVLRLEFEPGAFDREELARRVEAAIRSSISVLRLGVGSPQSNRVAWISLRAQATDHGVAIRCKYEPRSGHRILRDTPAPATPILNGPKGAPRLVDLAMAGGSLTMVVAAVVLPGIPTLPFLVMTARHTVRLSPRLEHLVRQRAWCAALLNHHEDLESGIGIDWWSLARTVLVTVLAVAALLVFRPPLAILIALEVGVMAVICLRKLRGMGRRAVELAVAA